MVMYNAITHWGWDKMAAIFQTTVSNGFSWMKMYEFRIEVSLKFVPKGPINNIQSLVQIMAWCRPGDKPLSEPMLVNLPMHIWVTRPQWVKTHCFLVTPYDVTEVDQYWFRQWLIAWWHQAIVWVNQCWLTFSKVLWHSSKSNIRESGLATFLVNEFEKLYLWNDCSSLRGQWVNVY